MKRRKLKRLISTDRLPAIPREPAQIIGYIPGSSWRLGNERVVIATQLTLDRVLVRFNSPQMTEWKPSRSAPWPHGHLRD